MPKRAKAKSKKKPLKKKKTAKKAKAKKSAGKKKTARKAKKTSKKKSAARAAKVQAIKERVLGKVTHYYDRIGVAIVKLQSPLRVGDAVCLKRGERLLEQRVSSMQIDHMAVAQAKKGDIVGLKVDAEVHPGALVVPV